MKRFLILAMMLFPASALAFEITVLLALPWINWPSDAVLNIYSTL